MPCRTTSEQVNKTFDSFTSGFIYSGCNENAKNPLIYMTDGLLLGIILEAEKKKEPLKYDVIMLDEVHERG